jgi:hypothetical protein
MLLTHQVIKLERIHAVCFGRAPGSERTRSSAGQVGRNEPGTSLALLERNVTTGLSRAVHPDRERNTALIKEDEFETPETIAIIEKNREDRERTVVMDR